jgi:hypothetical protein
VKIFSNAGWLFGNNGKASGAALFPNKNGTKLYNPI